MIPDRVPAGYPGRVVCIEIEREIRASPEAVFDVLADHRGWERWSGAREVVLRREGDPPPNGAGASRVIRARGLAIEEEITRFEPPERMEYRVVAGLPIRNHRAWLRLEPSGRGTRLRWEVRFDPRIPGSGPLLRRALRASLEHVLDRLSERVAGS
jgi:uncharacterized protein YndB with AHSA1/START domain